MSSRVDLRLRFWRRLSVGAFFILGGINMEVSTEMYAKLFNGITDVEKELSDIVERLKELQIEVEKIYMDNKKTDM